MDYILANPGKKADINAAFIEWHRSHVIAVQQKDGDVAALKAQALEGVAQAVAAKEEIRRQADAEVAALEADLAILGTKEEAQAMRAAQEAAKLDADIAALQAKRATLTLAPDGIFKALT